MHLKHLELHGFKSFPDRTVIECANIGLQVFTGNDSSDLFNIFRFALMETRVRNLDCNKLVEMICDEHAYNEANIKIEHAETIYDGSTSIHIRRRYFRSGESEYLINWLPCRLTDIKNLLDKQISVESISVWGSYDRKRFVDLAPEIRRRLWDIPLGVKKKMKKLSLQSKSIWDKKFEMEWMEKQLKDLSKQLYTSNNKASIDWPENQVEYIKKIQHRRDSIIEEYNTFRESLERMEKEHAELQGEVVLLIETEFQRLNQVFIQQMRHWTGKSAKLVLDLNIPLISGISIDGLPDSMSLEERNAVGWAFWTACMTVAKPPISLVQIDSKLDEPHKEQILTILNELSPNTQILVFNNGSWTL
ncbi:hypothetical protein B5M42_002255 [Paenibacillus athensensis]|nr:hypothetical protein [Paenibacillus athensensis]MCD1257661.1 hypothetical protein [Paenibacillus athensensis]